MPRLTRLSIAVIATENALSLNSLRRYARMNKCAMCGRLVEGRYVCKSCEKNVKGNLNPSSNPCRNCPARTSKCHSYCKEYAEWLKNRNAVKDIVYRQRCNDNDVYMSGIGKERKK
jgi:hypothetical protein